MLWIERSPCLLEGRSIPGCVSVMVRTRMRRARRSSRRGSLQPWWSPRVLYGNERVIPHSIWCRSKNGAPHRKNCDTPPLIGNCPDTLVSRQIPMKTHDPEMKRYLKRYRPLATNGGSCMADVDVIEERASRSCEATTCALANSVPSSRQMRRRRPKRMRRERGKTPSEWEQIYC